MFCVKFRKPGGRTGRTNGRFFMFSQYTPATIMTVSSTAAVKDDSSATERIPMG